MTQETINLLFQLVLIPLLGILTNFIVKWLNAKSKELQAITDNETATKYLKLVTETISDCVIATNQTYVETLKKEGKFDAAAQEMAFQLTKDAVMEILNEDSKKYLAAIYGDLDKYISSKIESEVNLKKAA